MAERCDEGEKQPINTFIIIGFIIASINILLTAQGGGAIVEKVYSSIELTSFLSSFLSFFLPPLLPSPTAAAKWCEEPPRWRQFLLRFADAQHPPRQVR